MEVITLKALNDNFMYVLVDLHTKKCAVIDPVEPQKIFDYVKKNNLIITYILTTHHHWDHSGGNKNLISMFDYKITIIGGDDRIEGLDCKVSNLQKLCFGNIEINCIHTPCHTTGHICYFCKNMASPSQDPVIFTGDTLFVAGCGRFFEGTAEQMYYSLIKVIREMPLSTKVYCGHEYTVKNLQFALTIEPNNLDIKNKLHWAQEQIKLGKNSVPSTILEEKKTNPFMRVDNMDVQEACNSCDPITSMGLLRKRKDEF